MKAPRALLLMLAGLAGGVGVRLAFSWPAEPRARRAENVSAPAPAAASPSRSATLATPQETAILHARAGARMRLLLAWLPGAGEQQLRRMATALVVSDAWDRLPLRLLMVRWAEVNPQAMLDWARTESGQRLMQRWITDDAINAWARADFDSAWIAVGTGPSEERAAALRGLAESDPDKCLRLLQTDRGLLYLEGGYTTMPEVIARLAARRPAETAALLDGAAPALRKSLAGSIGLAWAQADPAAAVRWMAQLEPPVASASLKEAGEWLAAHAPEHLPALVQSLPACKTRCIIEAAGLARLTATDPGAARRQIDAMPAGPAQQYGRGLLLKELVARGDEAGAIALASQLGWGFQWEWCPSYTEPVFTEVGLVSTSEGEEKPINDAIRQLMGRVALKDPQQAAAFLAKCDSLPLNFYLLSGEKNSHPAALARALLASARADAGEQVDYLVDNWVAEDPEAAASWALAHDRIGIVMKGWNYDTAAALAWAARQPADQRMALLQQAVGVWRNDSGVNTESAILHSPLTEEEKHQLLSSLRKP